jgi:hypothetical protein
MCTNWWNTLGVSTLKKGLKQSLGRVWATVEPANGFARAFNRPNAKKGPCCPVLAIGPPSAGSAAVRALN